MSMVFKINIDMINKIIFYDIKRLSRNIYACYNYRTIFPLFLLQQLKHISKFNILLSSNNLKDNMPNFIVSTEWKWQSSTLPVKKRAQGEQDNQQIVYQVISCDVETDHSQKVKIWLDKEFPFQKNIGFVWHKSWNLPQIKVTLDPQLTAAFYEDYDELFVQIMAVYPVKNSKFYYLHQVGLNGSNIQKFNSNIAQLKFLKFCATSFNYNRNKFCLLLLIRGSNIQGDTHDLYSMISSPIYVDSRKQARKKNQKGLTFLLSQSPKKFFAPIGSRKNSQFNNTQGFLSYYGAQNIRNKIKHFFYLGLHFDNIFTIYQNSSCQMPLDKILQAINIPNKYKETFLMVSIDTEVDKDRKKIMNLIEKWRFNYVQFAIYDTPISKKWVPITKQQIKSSYKTYYERQLLKEDDDNDLEEEDQEEKQNEKIKQERYFELRTIIDLSNGRKITKLEHDQS